MYIVSFVTYKQGVNRLDIRQSPEHISLCFVSLLTCNQAMNRVNIRVLSTCTPVYVEFVTYNHVVTRLGNRQSPYGHLPSVIRIAVFRHIFEQRVQRIMCACIVLAPYSLVMAQLRADSPDLSSRVLLCCFRSSRHPGNLSSKAARSS